MKTYKVESSQFTTNIIPIIAYILGLLWADGHVRPPYSVQLATTYPDAEYFIPLFQKTGDWKHYDKEFPEHKTWKRACTIKTSNKILVNFLLEHDYKSKSQESADKILSIIPEHLQYYWIRGLFDGDGHIYTDNKGSHRISFASSYNQNWNYLETLCKTLNIEYNIHKEIRKNNKASGSVFTIYGMYRVIEFCNFMYNGFPHDQLGLQRKYNKLLELKATEERNRYKGICQRKNGKWLAYTSCAEGNKWKSLGLHLTKEEALETVKNYYLTNSKCFLT